MARATYRRELAALLAIVVAAAALVLPVCGSRAQALETPLASAIAVEGSTACFDAKALAGDVARWLGRDAIDSRVAITVRAEEGPPAALSFVLLRRGEVVAMRRFDPPPAQCSDARAAVAIAIALAIEATILASAEAAASAPPAPPPPADRVSAGLDGVALVGVLPKPVVGVRASAGIDVLGWLALELAVIATARAEAPIGPGQATTELFAGELTGCSPRPQGRFGARACVGAAGGGVPAEGRGFSPSLSTVRPWGAFTGGVGLDAMASRRVGFEAGFDGFLPLIRPRLDVGSTGPGGPSFSRTLPVAGAGARLGVFMRF